VGNHSAVLENSVLVGWPGHPVKIGQRTVFGHRACVLGAHVGNVCEIGNGAILMPGSRLGDGCILGEGTLVPAGAIIPDDTVLVGRPPHVLRSATEADRARLAALRGGQVDLTRHPGTTVVAPAVAGVHMGQLYAYRDKSPRIAASAVLFDSAEVTGDVVIGEGSIIGAGVKIIGDSHGPVRIGARVQILENTVLHLLPDNELVVEDDVVIGPGAMIHGCHLGAGTVVEPAAMGRSTPRTCPHPFPSRRDPHGSRVPRLGHFRRVSRRWADRAIACPATGEVRTTNAIASTANVMIAAFSVATDEARTAITPGPVARPCACNWA
jgi:carbonic anhydrase/acetyltransferase-like protein (isoleucine patch superfamily)